MISIGEIETIKTITKFVGTDGWLFLKFYNSEGKFLDKLFICRLKDIKGKGQERISNFDKVYNVIINDLLNSNLKDGFITVYNTKYKIDPNFKISERIYVEDVNGSVYLLKIV